MGEFDNIEVKKVDTIYGNTTINHAVRVRLGLSFAEYVMADFIDYANSKRKLVTYEYMYRRIGMKDKNQISTLTGSLRDKGMITIDGPNFKVTRLWMDAFMISEEWFNAFWNINGKPYWGGSKADAQKKFTLLCRKYTPEYLINCRDAYVKFMKHPKNDFRQVMGAPVFLNPETERFKEDWKLQLDRLNGKGFSEAKKPELTAEAKERMFK